MTLCDPFGGMRLKISVREGFPGMRNTDLSSHLQNC
jgi:hypothetical protein